MRRVFLALAIFTIFTQILPAAIVFREGEGWTVEGPEGDEPVAKSATDQMNRAEKYEAEGETTKALASYRGLVRKFPESMLAPKAQFRSALLFEKLGQPEAAFDAYGKYIKTYTRGEDFDAAVEGQFRVAKQFLDGERRKMWGVKTFPSMDRAREMFESITKNAPFSKYAPLAQFYIGQAYEKQGKFPEAVAAYEAVVARYGTDTIAGDAQYQIGYVYLTQYQTGSYDPDTAIKAREAFEDFLSRYPQHEKVAQVNENLKLLESRGTQGAFEIAKFYDKTKNYKAAVIYYNEVIKQQPGSKDSDFAKARIDELKSTVGEDVLRAGPEKTETGARAKVRRNFQAQVDTASRPDFNGPPVQLPVVPDEVPPAKPSLRSSTGEGNAPAPSDVPAVEPSLPAQ